MKNLKSTLIKWLDRLNDRWQALPVKKQHRYTLMIFLGYLLLSVVMLIKACHDLTHPNPEIRIEHIENPTLNQNLSLDARPDSLSTIFKQ